MNDNEEKYSYTLKVNQAEINEKVENMSALIEILDKYETHAQNTTQVIEKKFKPILLTCIKDLNLLNLSLEKQIADMTYWAKALGEVIPLFAKVHEEVENRFIH